MRSFILLTILGCFFWTKLSWAQTTADLFMMEIPIEASEERELEPLFARAMQGVLVRVVGGDSILQTEQANQYINNARQWVRRYAFDNVESEGVVVGRKIIVEFERSRLMNAFERDQIYLWPLSDRPKTLLIGQWEQRGLSVDISAQSLQYRVDLAFEDYTQGLALEVSVPADDSFYRDFDLSRLLLQEQLPESLQQAWQDTVSQDYLMVFKADVIGTMTRYEWALFSLQSGQRVLYADEIGETMMDMLHSSFDQLMAHYSRPFRAGAGSLGLMQLDIGGVSAYADFERLQQDLTAMRPWIQSIRLLRVHTDQLSYEIVYQGHYREILRSLEVSGLFADIESRQAGVHLYADYQAPKSSATSYTD